MNVSREGFESTLSTFLVASKDSLRPEGGLLVREAFFDKLCDSHVWEGMIWEQTLSPV